MSRVKEPFRESTFYSSYKEIRNQFRHYDSLQIIDACISYLYSPTKTKIDQLKKNPWLILLLIKWVLLDEEFASSTKKALEPAKLNKIFQMLHDLSGMG